MALVGACMDMEGRINDERRSIRRVVVCIPLMLSIILSRLWALLLSSVALDFLIFFEVYFESPNPTECSVILAELFLFLEDAKCRHEHDHLLHR
jgi:hypothetical protein